MSLNCSKNETEPSEAKELRLETVAHRLTVFAAALAFCVVTGPVSAGSITIDKDDIGGTVTSAKGVEAGVWVIAETNDLPTKFVKIVVTNDRGDYVLPDLPQANY